ncbi:MAG: hypothetical protein AB4080_14540 [Trichodesmium sp.]
MRFCQVAAGGDRSSKISIRERAVAERCGCNMALEAPLELKRIIGNYILGTY